MKRNRIQTSDTQITAALGIVSPIPDYRICYLINKTCGTAFERSGTFTYTSKHSAADTHFPCFSFTDEETGTHYYLISNRQETGIVIPKYKQADYIMCIVQKENGERLREFQQAVNHISEIQTTFVLPSDQLSHIDVQ